MQLQRSTDPAFAASVREAVAGAKESLSQTPDQVRGAGRSCRPAGGWGSLDGAELVVRGTNGVRVQIARARLRQWTPRVEARFLRVLAATCNVKTASAEAGLSVASAYKHRERWPEFARRWDEAVADGCVALEAALLEAGAQALSPGEAEAAGEEAAPAIIGMDAHAALHLLHMHKLYQPRAGRWPGRPPSRATEGEVAAAIERALDRLERRKRKGRDGCGGVADAGGRPSRNPG